MKRGPGASRVIKIACPACDARPDERCAGEFYHEWSDATAGAR